MAFPCCMGLNNGVRVAALLSVLLALGLGAVSGWMFKDMYDERNSDAVKFRDAGSGILNSVFEATGIEAKADPDKLLRIKFACSGTVFAAAILQLITSLLLLCCSATKGGRSTAKLYIFINTWVIVAVIAVAVCFFTSGVDYKDNQQIQYFLGASAADLVFLLYLLCVAGAFART